MVRDRIPRTIYQRRAGDDQLFDKPVVEPTLTDSFTNDRRVEDEAVGILNLGLHQPRQVRHDLTQVVADAPDSFGRRHSGSSVFVNLVALQRANAGPVALADLALGRSTQT